MSTARDRLPLLPWRNRIDLWRDISRSRAGLVALVMGVSLLAILPLLALVKEVLLSGQEQAAGLGPMDSLRFAAPCFWC